MRNGERVGAHGAQAARRADRGANQQNFTADPINQTTGNVCAENLNGSQYDGGTMWIDGGAGIVKNCRRIVDEGKATAELVQNTERNADK